MKLVFIGATHEVTGSCTYINACGKHILVDFGMEQGVDVYENVQVPTSPSNIDLVLLTHAHIDHSGLLPLLCAGGFRGEIHCTKATASLCAIMLRDSAHIQEFECEWRTRKAKRKGLDDVQPLYTINDAEDAIKCLVPHDYGEVVQICEGIEARFSDAGHLLGSASIEVRITEGGESRKLIFSGDIGNKNQPLLRDPQYLESADYVLMESTYGTRLHERPADYASALAEVLQRTFDRGGNVVIPSFAVGRTQEMLYFIRQIKERGLVTGHEGFPVYVDSPLAIDATAIFMSNKDSCYDEEAMDYVSRGVNPIMFDDLRLSVTSDESRAINFDRTPKVIISASGMCEAGRIKHHLKHNLWRPECTVVFVGYQAAATLGRSLCEGASKVKLFGEEISVRAEITILPGVSGHADKAGLDEWIGHIQKPKAVFVNHGESAIAEQYTLHLREELGLEAFCPYSGAELDLLTGEFRNTEPVPITRTAKPSTAYQRLVASLDRLTAIVQSSKGLTNKELGKMADTIANLCSKWGS
ncbi:MAG: MBL fold metallo-hydrolase [Ruminococcus sp.]|nr:MBL fold metallo-hydrolase [Ruminococcus sp.]